MVNEATARIGINKLLEESGWRFEDSAAGRANIRLEENTTMSANKRGAIDYLLLGDNQRPICVLEAKREDIEPLSAKEQARKYANSVSCPFVILSNGKKHYFWDVKHDDPQRVTKFPTPSSLQDRTKYSQNPQQLDKAEVGENYLESKKFKLRDYQIEAIQAVQKAAQKSKTRFLLEMATGTGKTTIAAALCKLFIRTGQAHRILFLVDRIELENQAVKNFRDIYGKNYTVCTYKSREWRGAHIVVSTVQSLSRNNRYRQDFSPTDFNLVISDEAHRSISGTSRAVFEFFVGYKLGLTATPKDYLKDTEGMSVKNPKEWERRNMLDTYKTFGCEGSEPTYRYKLADGVNDNFLIAAVTMDARTNITTQLLSEKGYAITLPPDDDGDEETVIYDFKDYEVKFINDNTNRVYCEALLKNGLRDPITREFGKTLIFCVRRYHAARIVQMLNQCAREAFPGKYNESDFAVQVTSDVPEAQKYAKDFANNRLNERSQFAEDKYPDYDTSKTRVCVTVGMMTTGYDCPDLLNVVLLRPIFSPSDFVQMTGRGTRKYTFHYKETDEKAEKNEFMIFDCFANYEYFKKKFNYDKKLILPKVSKGDDDAPTGSGDRTENKPPALPPDFVDTTPDKIHLIVIGKEELKVGGHLPLHEQFENVIQESEQIRAMLEKDNVDDVLEFVKANVLNEERGWTAVKIRESYERAHKPDRKISLSDMVLKACQKDEQFKTRKERIDEEFVKFCDIQKWEFPAEKSGQADTLKQFFENYLSDSGFREIIDSRGFPQLVAYPGFGTKDLDEIEDFALGTAEYINLYLQQELAEFDWKIAA